MTTERKPPKFIKSDGLLTGRRVSVPRLDGSASRTLLLFTVIVCGALLCWAGRIDGQAFGVLAAAIVGAAVHAGGVKAGKG